VAKEREISSHASKEKGRFARTAKQEYSVHHACARKAASVDGLPGEIIRDSERCLTVSGLGRACFALGE
jgi:hypothetical protein